MVDRLQLLYEFQADGPKCLGCRRVRVGFECDFEGDSEMRWNVANLLQ